MKVQTLTDRQTDKIIPRQSNIELLRIIAMILIVAHHFSVHGGFQFSTETITINRLWIQFIQIGGKIGVDAFVLISGYFLVTSAALRSNKIIKLWLQIFTYSIVIFFIFIRFGIAPFDIKELITHFFPITYSQWWFASTYFVLYLVSPYINSLLNTLTKKSYQHFLILLTFCWCIIPTFLAASWKSNELLWFVYLYALAGYVRLHATKNTIKGSTYIILSFALTTLTFMSAVVLDLLGTKVSFFGFHATYFYDMQRLPILLISFCMFIGFLRINIGYKRIINVISSATFGVYLIHDNPYVRPFLWKTVFVNASYSESDLLIPYSLLAIMLVFIACTIIELFRIYALEKHYIKFTNKVACIADKYLEKSFFIKLFDKI